MTTPPTPMTPEQRAAIRKFYDCTGQEQMSRIQGSALGHISILLDQLAVETQRADAAESSNENLTQFCRDAQSLAIEIVWGVKAGKPMTPEISYTAGIGGVQQAFDILKAERDQLAGEVERFRGIIDAAGGLSTGWKHGTEGRHLLAIQSILSGNGEVKHDGLAEEIQRLKEEYRPALESVGWFVRENADLKEQLAEHAALCGKLREAVVEKLTFDPDSYDPWDRGYALAKEDALAIIDSLAPAPKPEAVVEPWQKIETAPMDGSRILVATPLADSSLMVLEASFRDENWRAWRDWTTLCAPTYWMPMPRPPQIPESAPEAIPIKQTDDPRSLYIIPDGCICLGDGLYGVECTADRHAYLKDTIHTSGCRTGGDCPCSKQEE